MKNNKAKLAFVFFGFKNTDACFEKQLKNIEDSIKDLSEVLDFEIIDCSRSGLNDSRLIRIPLDGFISEVNTYENYDPLAEFRNDKRRLMTGGTKFATIFIQAKDFNDIIKKRPDIDFIFRLRLDLLVSKELICKAISAVLPENNKSPFKVFKHKSWVQFFNLVEPFFIMDTCFLCSSFDLKKITDSALESAKYYRFNSLPSSLWGPIFFNENRFLAIFALNFYRDKSSSVNLSSNDLNIIPLYWKYVVANFYVDYSPEIINYMQWDIQRPQKRYWLNINKDKVLKLSLFQIYLLYKLSNISYLESNLSYKDIYKISNNKTFNVRGNLIMIKVIIIFLFEKLKRILLKKFNLGGYD